MKWFLISETDVQKILTLLEDATVYRNDQIEEAMYLLNTGTHKSNCMPKDFEKEEDD